jgi:hypothetical protein
MNFINQQPCSHKITHRFTLGSSGSCTQALRTEKDITEMPLPALDGVRHLCLRRSRWRRGPGWGGVGATRPTEATEHDGGSCARRAAAEHGRRRAMAAAVLGRRRSRRGAGEHGGTRHA